MERVCLEDTSVAGSVAPLIWKLLFGGRAVAEIFSTAVLKVLGCVGNHRSSDERAVRGKHFHINNTPMFKRRHPHSTRLLNDTFKAD